MPDVLLDATLFYSCVMQQVLISAAGIVCLAIGVAGIVLPLIPGTPLIILSAACFARSSPSMHRWLLSHPHLGPIVTRWEAEGAISRKTKLLVTVVLVAACSFSAATLRSVPVVIGFGIMVPGLLAYIWSRPEPK